MRSSVVRLRSNEHPTDRRGVRVELWQETGFQKIDNGTQGEGPHARHVRSGGHRFGHGPQVPSTNMHLLVQSHGLRKLYGLLSG